MTIILYSSSPQQPLPKILLPQPKCILPFVNRIKKQIQTDLKRKLY